MSLTPIRHLLALLACVLASGCLYAKRTVSQQYVPEDQPPQAGFHVRSADGNVYKVTLNWKIKKGPAGPDYIPDSEITFKIVRPDDSEDLDTFTTDAGMLLRNVRLRSLPDEDVLVLTSQQFVSLTPRVTEYVVARSVTGAMTLKRRANFWIESDGKPSGVPE